MKNQRHVQHRSQCRLLPVALVIWLIAPTALLAEEVLEAEMSPAVQGERYLYVDDVIYINVRSGPEAQAPTLKVIKSGVRMKLLQRDEERGVSRVILDTGEEGWVLNRYVRETPIARQLIDTANRKIERLENTAKEQKDAVHQFQAQRDNSNAELTSLKQENKRLSRELSEIKAISSNAVKAMDQNRALTLEKGRQDKKLREIESEHAALKSKVYMIGIGAALVSLALGAYIGYTPTRRQSRWRQVS